MTKEFIPRIEDWVKNRKYVAVLKDGESFGEDWDDGQEPHYMCESHVFEFCNLTDVIQHEDGAIILWFNEAEGLNRFVNINDVEFYKKEQPPLLNLVKQTFEQH